MNNINLTSHSNQREACAPELKQGISCDNDKTI